MANIVLAVSLPPCTKIVYHFTCTEQIASYSSGVHWSIHSCEFLVWDLLHITCLVPRIWKICGPLWW